MAAFHSRFYIFKNRQVVTIFKTQVCSCNGICCVDFGNAQQYCNRNSLVYRFLQTGPKGTYIAKHIPAFVQLEEGKKYSWCKCGLSKKQPFCDGAHKTTEFKPIRFRAETTKKVLLCQCKQTSNEPYCDMTHVSVMLKTAGKKMGRLFGSKS